jgi:hypothetical protein
MRSPDGREAAVIKSSVGNRVGHLAPALRLAGTRDAAL